MKRVIGNEGESVQEKEIQVRDFSKFKTYLGRVDFACENLSNVQKNWRLTSYICILTLLYICIRLCIHIYLSFIGVSSLYRVNLDCVTKEPMILKISIAKSPSNRLIYFNLLFYLFIFLYIHLFISHTGV